jgi:cation transport regulator ChaC
MGGGDVIHTVDVRTDTVGAMRDTWVFGYGSLVSPESLATTIGRLIAPHETAVVHLDGYGRRWNYGAGHARGTWTHDGVTVRDGVVVALGLVTAPGESTNGVAFAATDDDIARLDRREADYDRTDVTESIRGDVPTGVRIVTYVPRQSAIARYERARDDHRAAIRQPYWDLVRGAFDGLGVEHARAYATTPAPDVPVVDMSAPGR